METDITYCTKMETDYCTSGTSGVSATSGTSGRNGSSGSSGKSGSSGSSGTSGNSGNHGAISDVWIYTGFTAVPLWNTFMILTDPVYSPLSSDITNVYISDQSANDNGQLVMLNSFNVGDYIQLTKEYTTGSFYLFKITSKQYSTSTNYGVVLINGNDFIEMMEGDRWVISFSKSSVSGSSGTSGVSNINVINGTSNGQFLFWDNSISMYKNTNVSELYWDDIKKINYVNNYLVVGDTSFRGITGSTSSPLQIFKNSSKYGNSPTIELVSSSPSPTIAVNPIGNSLSNPEWITSGTTISSFLIRGTNNLGNTIGNKANWVVKSFNNWSSTDYSTYQSWAVTNETTISQRMSLTSRGDLILNNTYSPQLSSIKGKLHIESTETFDKGKPCLYLDKQTNNNNDPFIRFDGEISSGITSSGITNIFIGEGGNSTEWNGPKKGEYDGFDYTGLIKININGEEAWIPYYKKKI